MNLSLNTRPLPSWLRPSCLSREKLRLNLMLTPLLVAGLIILGFSFSALIYLIYASTGSPDTWKQALSVGLTQWSENPLRLTNRLSQIHPRLSRLSPRKSQISCGQKC